MAQPSSGGIARVVITVNLVSLALVGCGSENGATSPENLCNELSTYTRQVGDLADLSRVPGQDELQDRFSALLMTLEDLKPLVDEDMRDQVDLQVEGWTKIRETFAKYDYDIKEIPRRVKRQIKVSGRQYADSTRKMFDYARESCDEVE